MDVEMKIVFKHIRYWSGIELITPSVLSKSTLFNLRCAIPDFEDENCMWESKWDKSWWLANKMERMVNNVISAILIFRPLFEGVAGSLFFSFGSTILSSCLLDYSVLRYNFLVLLFKRSRTQSLRHEHLPCFRVLWLYYLVFLFGSKSLAMNSFAFIHFSSVLFEKRSHSRICVIKRDSKMWNKWTASL
jgi:hypothetical protein